MADEINKDVVAARINLDASKILPAFKEIDASVKMVHSTFKTLNQEVTSTDKALDKVAKTMDKLALSSDERRQKILAESQALIAQRQASAQLLTAKKNALDLTNQITDTKLQAQQAIVKKHATAIEQQEKEHQQRMATLQQKTAAASGQENLVQVKIDREFQMMKNGDARLEMEAERHAARLRKITEQGNNALIDRNMFARSMQYMATGSLYYSTVQGAREAIQVIKDFEDTVVNLKRVMNSGADIKFVEKSMIQDAKDYGYALKDVGAVYVQVAQQGFNEKDTAALAKTALMAKNVESSFRDAEQAQQLLTGAVLNYNIQASESERLLDRINQVSNDYATDSNKLLQGINKVGSAAKNAGVPINELIGYLTVLNESGQSGNVAGNAIKSFISFSGRDIAVDKLREYVGEIKKANGEMMPFSEILAKVAAKWKTLSDVQRAEITQAIARGDQASRFITIMDNYDKVLKVAATSENSLGSAQRENAVAMTTLSKQTAQLKASWEGLMISIGESGLLGILKSIVHESKLLVDGFNSLPGPIRNTLVVALSLGAAIAILNAGMKVMTGQSLVAMVTGLVTATRAMAGMIVATNTANVAQKAFIATPIGATLTALAAVIGIVTIAWSHHNGAQNEVTQTMDANQREVFTLTDRYQQLKKIVDDNTKSDQEIKSAKVELSGVIDKISSQMPGLISQWDQHGKAIELNITKLEEWKRQYAGSVRIVEKDNIQKQTQVKNDLERDIKLLQVRQYATGEDNISIFDKYVMGDSVENRVTQINKDILEKGKLLAEAEQKIKSSRDSLDLVDGKKPAGKADDKKHTGSMTSDDVESAYKERKQQFEEKMSEFRHLVNIEQAGYQNATDQLAKLNEIKGQFTDLDSQDLYGIDEEIHRTDSGRKIKANGMGSPEGKAFQFPLNDIDNQKIKAEQMINDVAALIDEFSAKEFSLADGMDKVTGKVGLYTVHQDKLHEANVLLRGSIDGLTQRQGILNELYAAGKITTDEYNKSTEDVQSRIKNITDEVNKNSIAWWNDAKAIKEAKEQSAQDDFSNSEKWIAHEKAIREMSTQEELESWQRVQARFVEGSELRKRADEQVYAARKAAVTEDMALSEKWIAHKKAIGQLSLQEEIAAWERVQGRYLDGTEQRMKADEQLYALKKSNIQEEEKSIDDLFKKQKNVFEEAKRKEIDAIDKAKEAFVSAQDEKIKAIEKLLQAEQTANEDQDYDKQLAEKQARVKVLESAVGLDGKKERQDLLKEIEKMQEDRRRDLRKRDLEAQKQALQDEKTEKERAFDDQKKAAEKHYQDLLDALDKFTNDTTGRAETLKQLQILKESEKNAEILKNLDTFIAQYQEKMNRINQTSSYIPNVSSSSQGVQSPKTQKELDLEEYNRNKDLWEQANADGDTAHMDTYKRRNDQIRNKYGITEDTGKLQHFSEGGAVRGMRGQPVPVIAHGGELILNEGQQTNLFKLLNFSLPKIDFAMPSFDMKTPQVIHHHNNKFDNSISGGINMSGGDEVGVLYDQRDGLISRQQSLGKKVR